MRSLFEKICCKLTTLKEMPRRRTAEAKNLACHAQKRGAALIAVEN